MPRALWLASAALLLGACSPEGGSDRSKTQSAGATEANPDRYTVRGAIAQLPTDGPVAELQIHHEPIPDFRDRNGVVREFEDGSTGMREMVMPFPVAEGVSLEGFDNGDKVEFDFEVTWGATPYQVTAIRELPADTELNLGASEAPDDSPPDP